MLPRVPAASAVVSRPARWLSGLALLGLAQWFFGNLYEAVVLAPNLLSGTYAQLQAWQGYFTSTNPVYYYVPLTQLAAMAGWVAWWRAPVGTGRRRWLGRAALLSLLATLLTGYIVTQLNLALFFGPLASIRAQLPALALRWNVLNLVRVLLLGGALYATYQARRLEERTAAG